MANDLIPVSDEQAKALQEALKLGGQSLESVKALGSYLARIFGTVPDDLIGLAFGDALHIKRAENFVRIAAKAQQRLHDRGVQESEEVPLRIGLPLLGAAAEESRDELVDLWSRLLASAMDSARSERIRLKFIEVVHAMDPLDAVVLQMVLDNTNGQPSMRSVLSSRLQRSEDEIEISMAHLCELGCTVGNLGAEPTIRNLNILRVTLTAFGRELLRALS